MSSRQRRKIVSLLCSTGLALVMDAPLRAQGQAVDPKDPAAVALGFVADATRADKAKFPKYEAGQHCGTCQLFQGAAGAQAGPCPIFANKQVPAAGWCNAWVKKVG